MSSNEKQKSHGTSEGGRSYVEETRSGALPKNGQEDLKEVRQGALPKNCSEAMGGCEECKGTGVIPSSVYDNDSHRWMAGVGTQPCICQVY